MPADPSFTLAFAALLHDVGKPSTRVFHHGRYSFHNHEQVGARIADRLCRDLKLSNAERERITWLVEYHQYLGEAKKLRESKLKRILAEPGIDELLALHRADALASTGNTEHVDYCQRVPRDPAGRAHQSAAADHRPRPGPSRPRAGAQFAIILEQVREAQLDGQIHSKREALEWVDRQLAELSRLADRRPCRGPPDRTTVRRSPLPRSIAA